MSGGLLSACAACGAEETLDSIIARVIEDAELRRLLDDVLRVSLPLGSALIRYVRLFKPPKHQLGIARIGKVLGELVPAMQRSSIERNGRVFAVDAESWKAAFEAVFAAVDRGTLKLPLTHSGYLHTVLVAMVDTAKAEGQRESALRRAARQDTVTVKGQTLPIGEALQVAFAHKDPALAKIDADNRRAAPMPADVREQLDRLRNKQDPRP